ncbi:MAG: hypothetical protein GX620_03645 [Chloroflexi bacterium]|nr:hypothetical protein [Chloroflexota bacterium]
MTSRDRIKAAWSGQRSDHVPLTTWCFGLPAPDGLRWETNGRPVNHWYSLRLEHIHTLPEPWTLEDDFRRVLAWQSLGVDDILDVSVPWSVDASVTWEDSCVPAGEIDRYPVLVREYHTPSGSLRHEVRQTGEDPGLGWVVQPESVPLFEDYNIPRAVRHAVSRPEDVPIIRHLFQAPDAAAHDWFTERMTAVRAFADAHGVAVQAWAGFGMDGIVWLTGAEGAVMLAIDHPAAFGQLVDIVAEADVGRAELAAATPGVDMVVERGWYSSTDFWSPRLFDRFVYPQVERIAEVVHKHGKKFGYTMTTGVERLGPRLADAGVDVLYFVDPVQDGLPLESARDLLGDRMTMVGGTNALTLASGDVERIRNEVQHAVRALGPTNRFILQPTDAVFPDTPWHGIHTMIDAWMGVRELV